MMLCMHHMGVGTSLVLMVVLQAQHGAVDSLLSSRELRYNGKQDRR